MISLPSSFTIAQFIELTELDLNPHNPHQMRLVAAKLRSLGYSQKNQKIDGKNTRIWYKRDEEEKKITDLKSKLDELLS